MNDMSFEAVRRVSVPLDGNLKVVEQTVGRTEIVYRNVSAEHVGSFMLIGGVVFLLTFAMGLAASGGILGKANGWVGLVFGAAGFYGVFRLFVSRFHMVITPEFVTINDVDYHRRYFDRFHLGMQWESKQQDGRVNAKTVTLGMRYGNVDVPTNCHVTEVTSNEVVTYLNYLIAAMPIDVSEPDDLVEDYVPDGLTVVERSAKRVEVHYDSRPAEALARHVLVAVLCVLVGLPIGALIASVRPTPFGWSSGVAVCVLWVLAYWRVRRVQRFSLVITPDAVETCGNRFDRRDFGRFELGVTTRRFGDETTLVNFFYGDELWYSNCHVDTPDGDQLVAMLNGYLGEVAMRRPRRVSQQPISEYRPQKF